jgi:hypothetical protein
LMALDSEVVVGLPNDRNMLKHHLRFLYRAHKRGF